MQTHIVNAYVLQRRSWSSRLKRLTQCTAWRCSTRNCTCFDVDRLIRSTCTTPRTTSCTTPSPSKASLPTATTTSPNASRSTVSSCPTTTPSVSTRWTSPREPSASSSMCRTRRRACQSLRTAGTCWSRAIPTGWSSSTSRLAPRCVRCSWDWTSTGRSMQWREVMASMWFVTRRRMDWAGCVEWELTDTTGTASEGWRAPGRTSWTAPATWLCARTTTWSLPTMTTIGWCCWIRRSSLSARLSSSSLNHIASGSTPTHDVSTSESVLTTGPSKCSRPSEHRSRRTADLEQWTAGHSGSFPSSSLCLSHC